MNAKIQIQKITVSQASFCTKINFFISMEINKFFLWEGYAIFNKICLQENLLPKYTNIYICIVLFGPVKLELGVIPSGQENHSRSEHLNFPGREFNVISFTEQYFL